MGHGYDNKTDLDKLWQVVSYGIAGLSDTQKQYYDALAVNRDSCMMDLVV